MKVLLINGSPDAKGSTYTALHEMEKVFTEADSDAVKELLIGSGIKGSSTATDGVFTKVESIVENSLQSVIGYFSIADAAYAREINKIDNKIVSGNEAIEKYRARLNKKFNSMDMLISNMQNQYSSFLS